MEKVICEFSTQEIFVSETVIIAASDIILLSTGQNALRHIPLTQFSISGLEKAHRKFIAIATSRVIAKFLKVISKLASTLAIVRVMAMLMLMLVGFLSLALGSRKCLHLNLDKTILYNMELGLIIMIHFWEEIFSMHNSPIKFINMVFRL